MNKMRNTLLKYALAATLTLGVPKYFSSQTNYSLENKQEQLNKIIEIKKQKQSQLEKELGTDYIPELAKFNLESRNCAGYARRAAQEHFNKLYHHRDSWDFRYNDEIVTKIQKEKDAYSQIDSLSRVGVLEPGMIIGAEYPGWKTKFKNEGITKDEKGKFPTYPHTMIYIGRNNGEVVIDQQWGRKIERVNLDYLKSKQIKPVEIINSVIDKYLAEEKGKDTQNNS